jgi:uncharacterized protein
MRTTRRKELWEARETAQSLRSFEGRGKKGFAEETAERTGTVGFSLCLSLAGPWTQRAHAIAKCCAVHEVGVLDEKGRTSRLAVGERSMADEPKKGQDERGFASMDPDKQREIAQKGGESVPDEKRSFSQDHELASEAGRKGGESVPDEKRSFAQDRELAAEAGRAGGQHSHSGNKPGTSARNEQDEDAGDERRGGSGNFADDRERASEAGRKGGSK